MRPLPNLDFLRSCAVMSVVAEHVLLAYDVQRIGYWQIRWIGVVGVFIFFVHTALVLMWSLERKPHTLDFYIRRIFRIYPLAIAVVAAVLFFHTPIDGTPTHFFVFQPARSWSALLGAVLLIPNVIGRYLPSGVMWSLPYEVEMYIALPVLFFFVKKNFSIWPLLFLWISIIALCHQLFRGAAHNIFLCVPYFLPGIMAYVCFSRYRSHLPAWTFPIFLILLWSAFMLHPGWRQADILCLVIGLALPLFHQLTNRTLITVSKTIAKYSYSVYLVHPFCIVLGLYLMPHRPLALQLTVIFVSLAILSFGAYHAIEEPMILLGKRVARRAEKRFEVTELQFERIPETEIR